VISQADASPGVSARAAALARRMRFMGSSSLFMCRVLALLRCRPGRAWRGRLMA
jgi:hypothetical protein